MHWILRRLGQVDRENNGVQQGGRRNGDRGKVIRSAPHRFYQIACGLASDWGDRAVFWLRWLGEPIVQVRLIHDAIVVCNGCCMEKLEMETHYHSVVRQPLALP